MQWSASPEIVDQTLSITLQKPLLVAELSFLLAVTQFVVPTFSFVRSNPILFKSHDILLRNEGFKATGDVWLSPSVRLLADTPYSSNTFEYDGQGHRIILPVKDQLEELLPLIIIGNSKRLRLKNVTIINADSLAACLQLSAGAKLIASPQDGVEMVDSGDAGKYGVIVPGVSPPVSPRWFGSPPGSKLAAFDAAGTAGSGPASPSGVGGEETAHPGPPAAAPIRSIQMTVIAAGLGLQFMQLQEEVPELRPDSAAGFARKHVSSVGDVLSIKPAPSSTGTIPRGASAGSALSAAATPKSRSVQLLAATMDLAAGYHSQGTHQKGNVCIQGLRIELQSINNATQVMQQRQEQELKRHRKVRGRMESVVLEPCKVLLKFDLLSDLESGKLLRYLIHFNFSNFVTTPQMMYYYW